MAAGVIPEKRVLIVDDSKFVRTTFNRILSASFAVREVGDGEAGWQAIETDPSIVMVVTDLDMPKLDGFGLLQKVRASGNRRVKELPIIIISGNQNEAAKKRARDMGANDFISKEADAPEVLWQSAKAVGDFRFSQRRYAEATVAFERALEIIEHPGKTRRAPAAATILQIFDRATQSRLLEHLRALARRCALEMAQSWPVAEPPLPGLTACGGGWAAGVLSRSR